MLSYMLTISKIKEKSKEKDNYYTGKRGGYSRGGPSRKMKKRTVASYQDC